MSDKRRLETSPFSLSAAEIRPFLFLFLFPSYEAPAAVLSLPIKYRPGDFFLFSGTVIHERKASLSPPFLSFSPPPLRSIYFPPLFVVSPLFNVTSFPSGCGG